MLALCAKKIEALWSGGNLEGGKVLLKLFLTDLKSYCNETGGF